MDNVDYDNILETVITELTEKRLREQRDENPEIEALIQENVILSVQIQKILSTLEENQRNILIKYYERSEAIADKQIKHLYIQGAKDGVLLLKSLGVF